MLGPTGHVPSPTAAHRYVPENCEDIAALPSGQWRRGVRRVITDCWGYTMKFRLHHHSMPMSPVVIERVSYLAPVTTVAGCKTCIRPVPYRVQPEWVVSRALCKITGAEH